MNPLTVSEIAQFAGATLSSGDGTVVINKVSTDSRTIKPGELFVALHGENFEGHDFIEAGAKAGATGALVDLNWAGNVPNNFVLLRATDTLQAYHEGFRRFGARAKISGHQDRREFQQSHRPATHNSGSNFRG